MKTPPTPPTSSTSSTPPPPYQQPVPSQQAPHPSAAPQQAPYASPIPARRAHLGDALASEWTKLRSVRATMWSLGVLVLLIVGVGVIAALLIVSARDASDVDAEVSGESMLGLGFFGVLLGSLCVITLGVLTITSEYGTGMIRTTLTACPSRARVLAAKSLVFFAVVFTVTTVTTMIVAALQIAILDTDAPGTTEWIRATVGVSFYLAMLGLLSMAVGALVRHSAGAITVMIGLVLLPLVLAIFMMARSLRGVQEFLLTYSIPSQLVQLYGDAFGTVGPGGWAALWIITGTTAVAMVGAFFSLDQRDV
ncbi:ABC transporter permease subunit [Streptomyces sp. NPDC087851]|uniref:ABC transporter permease subunit n=1 Tax=Streptomyces sp. NPDC087851 TaxID=3365810 RepID=UPI00380E203D